jgi:hypothetical protein
MGNRLFLSRPRSDDDPDISTVCCLYGVGITLWDDAITCHALSWHEFG